MTQAAALTTPKPGNGMTAAPATDLADALGITPDGRPLLRPRALRTAKYRITGASHDLPPSDNLQAVTYESGASPQQRVAVVSVTPQEVPAASGVSAFAASTDAPAALQPYLKSTAYVPADAPEFVVLAMTITGGETDTAKAARKIAAYVHQTITYDAGIAALRTARDIRRDPRGVCRDYTTLFATLARAAGIPTRQCVGVAYGDGKFMYHAWPEVWIGGENWVALEPTWGVPSADATHIKLAQGEITDLFNVAADMGHYRITVLEAQ
jgi:transglutaminase-like putative cysteine protease